MRKFILGALTLALIALAAVAAATWRDGDRDRDRQETPAAAPVYRIADAETAVAGRDYRVLRQVPGSIAHPAELILTDGTLVLWHRYRYDASAGGDLPDLVETWDPRTGRRESLPIRWSSEIKTVSATSASDIWVTFTRPGPQGRQHQAAHYDRETRQTRVFTVPHLERAKSWRTQDATQVGPDGRIYFLTGRDICYGSDCPETLDRELWSFALETPDRVRREAVAVGEYAVSRTHLVWTDLPESAGDPDMVLRARELASGQVHTRTVPSVSPVYRIPLLQAAEAYVLLAGNSSAQVFDTGLRQMGHLMIYDHGLSGITDRWIAHGWTVFDPESGRLLQIAEDGRIWHDKPVAMTGDLILFPTATGPPNTRNGTWTLARLRRP